MIGAAYFRRKEIIAAGLVFIVAAVVAMGIIPPVRADTSPMAAPESAAASFWVVGVIANVLAGATLCIAVFMRRRGRMVAHVLAGIAGLAAFVVGLLLLMPVGVFASHGPALDGARVAMAVGAAGDFAASVLALSAAGMFRRLGSVVRQVVQDLRTHRRVGVLFLVLWLALLVTFILSDAAGPALGKAAEAAEAAGRGLAWEWVLIGLARELAFLGCMLLPIPAGILVGWWRNVPAARQDEGHVIDSLLGGSLVGALVMALTFAVMVICGVIYTLLSGEAYQLDWEGVDFVTEFVIIGFVQGTIGGLIGAGLAAIWRRWHGQGGRPAAPAGVT